jgi:hypothetical protein
MSKFFQKSFTSDLLLGFGMISDAMGIASCLGGIAGIASVVGAVPGALLAAGCASTAIGIASAIFPESFKVAGPAGKVLGYATGITGCIRENVEDCVTTMGAAALDIANLANAMVENFNIAEAEKILRQGFTVSTNNVNTYTANSAVVGGAITADGVATIIERGVLYSTTPSPQITGTRFQIGSGAGNFSSTLNGLTPDTIYYVIAYAKSTVTTLYGTSVSFKTKAQAKLPTLTTTVATLVTATTATSGGNIVSDGGATITSKGVCWSTNQNPTISSTKTSNGTGTGTFTSSITELSPNSIYYVRAYATNSAGTAYGNQVSFTTASVLPYLDPIVGRWKSTEVWHDCCKSDWSKPIQGYSYAIFQANYNVIGEIVLFGETYGCTGNSEEAGTWRKSNNNYYLDFADASCLVTITSDGHTLCLKYVGKDGGDECFTRE